MDIAIMQAVRLKGMGTAEAIAAATGKAAGDVSSTLQELLAAGQVMEKAERFRATPEGRAALDEELAEERAGVDSGLVTSLYEQFTPLNNEFKELVNRWQMKDGEPNDHTDAAYDGGVLDQLGALHEKFAPLAGQIAGLVPRLSPYPQRFVTALEGVRAGDTSLFLHPLKDSYHQVWFELHEELIGLAGLNRVEEAQEGRA